MIGDPRLVAALLNSLLVAVLSSALSVVLGFLVMLFAARHVLAGEHVLPTWLICTYFLHTLGELSLSPVGLSYMSKLAPPRFVGQVMGVWFLSLALGANLAGQLSGTIDTSHMESLPGLYAQIFWSCVAAGLTSKRVTSPVIAENTSRPLRYPNR